MVSSWCHRGRVLPQEKQLWFSPEGTSISLLAARRRASWLTFRVMDKSLWNQWLKKKCLRISQAALSPLSFWDVTGPYAGLVVRSVWRLWTDMWALRLAGNLRSGCRQCRSIPSLVGGSLPPCPQPSQTALASWAREGLSGMLGKRLGCYVRSVCDLFIF